MTRAVARGNLSHGALVEVELGGVAYHLQYRVIYQGQTHAGRPHYHCHQFVTHKGAQDVEHLDTRESADNLDYVLVDVAQGCGIRNWEAEIGRLYRYMKYRWDVCRPMVYLTHWSGLSFCRS